MGSRSRRPVADAQPQDVAIRTAEMESDELGSMSDQAAQQGGDAEEVCPPLELSVLEAAMGAVNQPTPAPVTSTPAAAPSAPQLAARAAQSQERVSTPGVDRGTGSATGFEGGGFDDLSFDGGGGQGFQAPVQGLVAVDSDVPQIGEAWGRFSEHAAGVRSRIESAVIQEQTLLRQAAEGAYNQVLTTSTQMVVEVAGRFEATRTRIRDAATLTRENLSIALDARKAELREANAAQAERVKSTAADHQAEIRSLITQLAADARAHGLGLQTDLEGEATNHASQAVAAGVSVAEEWASHSRAHDIGVTVRRMASEASTAYTDQVGGQAHALAQDGEDLAVKIEEDGALFLENLTVDGSLGGESIDDAYAAMLVDAEAAMDEAHVGILATVDQTEADGLAQVDDAELSVNDQLDATTDAQLAGIDAALREGLEGLDAAGLRALEDFDVQLADIQAFVDNADPTQWPAVVAELLRLQGELDATADGFEASLAETGRQAASTLTDAGEQCAADLALVADDLQTHLDDIVAGVEEGLVQAEVDFDTALGEQIVSCTDAWTADADEKIGVLDAARDEARDNLEETSRLGIEEMDGKYDATVDEMTDSLVTLRSDLNDKAEEIANQSSWDRFWSGVGNFFLGIFDAIVDFVKVLLIVALVILVIAAIVLIIAAIVGGSAAVGAVIAAVAAFVAAAAEVIAVIGLILTIVGVVFAIVSVAAAWMDPNLTTDERWRATGKGVGDILLEFLPDFGMSILTRGDDVADAARAVDNVGDIVTHADDLADAGRAVENASDVAGHTDELAELADGGRRLLDDVEEAEDGLRAIDEALEVADDLEPPTRQPVDPAELAPGGQTPVSPDAPTPGSRAHYDEAAESGYGGGFDMWQRQIDEGFRFDPETRRWRRPDDVNVWDSWEAARREGYSGSFETWETQTGRGLEFNFETRRWRRPAPETPVTSPEGTTAPQATPAQHGPEETAALDQQAEDWAAQWRRVRDAYQRADDGSLPALKTSYDLFKGIAMSLWQSVTGVGSFVENLEKSHDYVFGNATPHAEVEASVQGQ